MIVVVVAVKVFAVLSATAIAEDDGDGSGSGSVVDCGVVADDTEAAHQGKFARSNNNFRSSVNV